MEMTEVFDSLKKLQGVLVSRYEIEKQIESAPKQLGSQEEFLCTLEKEMNAKDAEYQTIKENVEKLKVELEDAVTSRENGEKNMDNVTTHREYEALDKQIAEASIREKEVRASLQKEEKRLEESLASLENSKSLIDSQKAELDEGRSVLDKQVAEFKSQLDDLKKSEDEISSRLDEKYQETVHKFHSIIKRNSEGIVAVRNGVCMGCHMILPAQFANEVRGGEKILFCPYCSRILFYEETGEEEQESFLDLDETGSLADFLSDEEDDFSDDSEDDSFAAQGEDGYDSSSDDGFSSSGDDGIVDDEDDEDEGEDELDDDGDSESDAE